MPSVSPLTRDDPTYRGVETDQAGVSADLCLLCLVWAYPDEDQERGLTPGVTDLIMSNRELLSETISVATDLRSHNECIE